MCTMHVFLGLVRVLDTWQLEGSSGAQAAAGWIHHTHNMINLITALFNCNLPDGDVLPDRILEVGPSPKDVLAVI